MAQLDATVDMMCPQLFLSRSLSLLTALAFLEVSSPLWIQPSPSVQVDKLPGLHGTT